MRSPLAAQPLGLRLVMRASCARVTGVLILSGLALTTWPAISDGALKGRPPGNVVVKRVKLQTGPWQSRAQRPPPPPTPIKFNLAKKGHFRAYTYNNALMRGRVGTHPKDVIKSLSASGIETCKTPGIPAAVTRPTQVTVLELKLNPKSFSYKREGDKIQSWSMPKEPLIQTLPNSAGVRTLSFQGGWGTSPRDMRLAISVTDTVAASPGMKCKAILLAPMRPH